MKRYSFTPEIGEEFQNQGGSIYKCIKVNSDGTAIMQNVYSKWTLTAHGLGMYTDGSIDWDYSTGGYFAK